MVFEMGLDPETVSRARVALEQLAETDPSSGVVLGISYPAITLTYIVGEANTGYRHGALWPNLPIRSFSTTELREAFEIALEFLKLEPFQQLADEGHRYVTPILAHGGIPAFSARDFWRLLVSELEEVPGADAEELMRRWRSRPTAFDGIDKPVGRFLLFGSDVARNFLDRCIDLASSPKGESLRSSGLPDHVVEAFARLELDEEVERVRGGFSVPRPRLLLDPWDRLGPYLELPGVPAELGGAHWLIRSGAAEPTNVPCSRDRQALAVPPSSNWHVDFVSWPRTRPFDFEGSSGAVLLFDPKSGEHQTSTRAVVLEDAWVLEPLDAEIKVELALGELVAPAILEHLPPLGGDWEGYVLRRVDLRTVQSIRAKRADGTTQVIRIQPPGARTSLFGEPVAGVTSDAGNDVFDQVPRIAIPPVAGVTAARWTIEVQTLGQVQRRSASQLGGIAKPVVIASLVPERFVGELQLSVLGPLGFDLRSAFAVVTGLVVSASTGQLLLPGDRGETTVRADPSVSINGVSGPVTLPLSAADSDLHVEFEGAGRSLGVRIRTPKLTWALQGPGSPAPLSAEVLEVAAADIRDRKYESLVIATERDGLPARLMLCDGERELQLTQVIRTSGDRGRWRFPLDQFTESLTNSDAPAPEFALRVNERSVRLVRILARVAATDFAVRLVVRDEHRVVRLGYAESHLIRQRVALLWPLDRPWDPPAKADIPDGTLGEAIFRPEQVPPGRYRAQVSVSAGWIEPLRPKPDDRNTKELSIFGTPRRAEDARDLLGIALESGKRPIALDDHKLASLAPEVLAAIEFYFSEAPLGDIPHRASFAATLLLSSSATYPGLIADLHDARLSTNRLVQLAVLALPLSGTSVALPDDVMRALWRACPPLAARIDVPAARSNHKAALDRCRELMGWQPATGLPIPTIGLSYGSWLLSSPEQIRAMYSARRTDEPATSQAAYLAASLEWIANARQSPDAVNRWWTLYGAALSVPRAGADERMRAYIARRVKARDLPGTAGVPQAILGAADRLVSMDKEAEFARAALYSAAEFAPRLIDYDLTLAITVRGATDTERIRFLMPVPPALPTTKRFKPPAVDLPERDVSVEKAYQRLVDWRHRLMKRAHDFYIFTDEDLRKIAVRRPRSVDELRAMIINPDKLARHAEGILSAIWGVTRNGQRF
jgi:hypothetical protein